MIDRSVNRRRNRPEITSAAAGTHASLFRDRRDVPPLESSPAIFETRPELPHSKRCAETESPVRQLDGLATDSSIPSDLCRDYGRLGLRKTVRLARRRRLGSYLGDCFRDPYDGHHDPSCWPDLAQGPFSKKGTAKSRTRSSPGICQTGINSRSRSCLNPAHRVERPPPHAISTGLRKQWPTR